MKIMARGNIIIFLKKGKYKKIKSRHRQSHMADIQQSKEWSHLSEQ